MCAQWWEGMANLVRESLKKIPDDKKPFVFGEKLIAFELSEDHEIPVLNCYEYLFNGAWQYINKCNFFDTKIDNSLLQILRNKINDDDRLIRWVLLLHDISKDRDLNELLYGPHPHTASKVVGLFDFLNEIKPGLVDDVKQLVYYHDVLGNLYTGEQRYQELFDALSVSSWEEIDTNSEAIRWLSLLQIIVFCDICGSSGGIYLSNEMLKFWLDVKNERSKFSSFVEYRVSAWTGGEFRNRDKKQKELAYEVLSKLDDNTRFIFSKKIGRISQGFYLFNAIVKVSPEHLSTLLKKVAEEYSKLNPEPSVVHLQFDKYRENQNQDYVINGYMQSINADNLHFDYDESVNILYILPNSSIKQQGVDLHGC